MSINKKALTRYLAYDKCLRNIGKHSWQDLVSKANDALAEEGLDGIGKTQFYADINFMQSSEWKAPIERYKEGRTVYFKYSDKNYSINNQPLNETEVKQLNSAIHVLSRFKGMPQFEWINEIIPILETKLGLVSVQNEILSFDSNIDYEGLINITPLFNAIVNKKVLEISYQDFRNPDSYKIIFHPYYLKQYNNRWFAFGYNPDRNTEYWNIALDRIKEINEVKQKYVFKEVNWEDYFADFIGVTKFEGKPVEIKILIKDAEQAAYIKTKPLHQTQKPIKKVKDGFETSIEVIPNFELEKMILSFGERIKIISPKQFQKKIKERIKNSLAIYS